MKESLFFFETFALLFFRLWAEKIFSTFAGTVTASLSESRCTCSDEDLYKLNFLGRLLIFPQFRKSSKNFSEFWRENFGSVVTTALYMYIGSFLWKLFSFRKVQCFFRGFWNLSWKSVDSQRKFFATVVKIAYSVAKNRFWWKKNFVQKIVNSISSKFGRVFLIVANEVTTGLSKLRCFCSNDHFNKKVFNKAYKVFLISRTPAKIFQALTRKIWQDGHNYTLHVQKHNWRKNNFPSRKFIISPFLFWNLSDKSVVFWKKKFGRVDKIAFSFAREKSFLMITNSDKKIGTPYCLDYGKLFPTFGDRVTAVLSKYHCTC